MPIETLRAWARRYATSDTGRSALGQRLYFAAQVRRLRLMKQLERCRWKYPKLNHAAGSARMSLEALEALEALERLARADGLPLFAGM
ncbi:hypothetical protein GCM10008020_14620 [Massilia psychrophila]|nr:hypothetical protein GCM10008020_14620 [Massilia psychrophila]